MSLAGFGISMHWRNHGAKSHTFKKDRFPIGNLWNPSKHADLGSRGSGGGRGSFYCKYDWKNSPKDPYNSSASYGLVTFRFHHGRDRAPFFMIFGLWDVSMTPQTNIIYLMRHRNISDNLRKSQICLESSIFINLKISETQQFETSENAGTETSPRSAWKIFKILKILNMGSISSKNTKCKFG